MPPLGEASACVTRGLIGILLDLFGLLFVRAGASGSTHLPDATKLWCVEGSSQRRLTVYLPNCSQAVTPIFLFFASMVVHDTSHKQVFPRPPLSCRPPFVRCCRESADAHKPFVENTYNLIGLFTLPLSHSFSREIELTENQCQSVVGQNGVKELWAKDHNLT